MKRNESERWKGMGVWFLRHRESLFTLCSLHCSIKQGGNVPVPFLSELLIQVKLSNMTNWWTCGPSNCLSTIFFVVCESRIPGVKTMIGRSGLSFRQKNRWMMRNERCSTSQFNHIQIRNASIDQGQYQ